MTPTCCTACSRTSAPPKASNGSRLSPLESSTPSTQQGGRARRPLGLLPIRIGQPGGEWKRDHPHTTVLSLDTGFERNDEEGAAYREYFATDRTMFETPLKDTRLRNKAEVLVLRPEVLRPGSRAVAIAVERLKREPVYRVDPGGRALVVITSRGGTNRVYEREAHTFRTRDGDAMVRDANGGRWRATPQALVHETTGERVAAVPAHRVFWFGWVAQYSDSVLHK